MCEIRQGKRLIRKVRVDQDENTVLVASKSWVPPDEGLMGRDSVILKFKVPGVQVDLCMQCKHKHTQELTLKNKFVSIEYGNLLTAK